jgi:hypothetical protein
MIRRAVTFHNTQIIHVEHMLQTTKERFLFSLYEMRLLMLTFKRLVIGFRRAGWYVCRPKNGWRGAHVSDSLLNLN